MKICEEQPPCNIHMFLKSVLQMHYGGSMYYFSFRLQKWPEWWLIVSKACLQSVQAHGHHSTSRGNPHGRHFVCVLLFDCRLNQLLKTYTCNQCIVLEIFQPNFWSKMRINDKTDLKKHVYLPKAMWQKFGPIQLCDPKMLRNKSS